jgi:hypothetical protein
MSTGKICKLKIFVNGKKFEGLKICWIRLEKESCHMLKTEINP